MSQSGTYINLIGAVETITGDAGGAVSPDGSGNLTLTGTAPITVTGTPATGSLDIALSGSVSTSFLTDDANTATPALGVLTIAGGDNIYTTSAGDTVTISVADTTQFAVQTGNAAGSLNSLPVGDDGEVLVGASGADPAFVALTSTGGSISFTTGANSLNLEASASVATTFTEDAGSAIPAGHILNILGGAGLTTSGAGNTVTIDLDGFTQDEIVIGNASNGLDSLGAMTDGQIIIGDSGDTPAIANITDGNNITWSNGSGTLRADLTGTSSHAVQVGNALGSLTSLATGGDGEVLIGAGGANPQFASILSAGSTIQVTGGPNTLNLETGGALATSYETDDANSATPSSGVLTVAGGTNISSTSGGSTVTLNLDDTITLTKVNATTFDTNVAAAGSTLSGTTLEADGTDANIDLNLTPKGTGLVNITYATENAVAVYTASGGLDEVGPLTNGQLLIGSTGNPAQAATLTDGNNITSTEGAGSISIAVTGTTDHCVQVGNASGSLTSLGAMTNGQIVIGNTGNDPDTATLTAGDGIDITNAAGSVTITNTGGGITWNEVSGATNMAVDNGYIYNAAGAADLTLPDTAAQGSIIRVVGTGSGLFTIAQNAGEQIHFGNDDTTVGVGGSIVSRSQYNAIEIVCTTANTDWTVLSTVGNFDVN